MLTISNPLFAGQARSYHQKEFTAKEQNYWSRRGVVAGEWQGRLAAQLGLARTVSAEDFAKLSHGQHPQTGEQGVRQRASYEHQDAAGNNLKMMEHRAGWDATCSAPRSVSLTPLVGTDQRVREAHRESVGVALDPFEHRTQARIGGNHPPEATGKFIAATFECDTALPVDGNVAPQLRARGVVSDITERDNGQPRASQPQSLASQQFATAVCQSELTNRMRQLGYEITAGRSSAPETKGYTAGYLDISSPRSQQIREYLERTDRSGRETAETAAHSRAKNFAREAVVDERALIRDSLSRGIGVITHAQVRANLDARVASGEFQIVGRSHIPDRPFTPAKTIEAEPEIVRRMQGGQNQIEQVLSHPRAMAVASVTGKKQHPIRCRGPKSFCPSFFPTQPAPITWRFPSVSRVCDERRTAAPLTAPRR